MNRNAILDAWRGLSGMSRTALLLLVAAVLVLAWFTPQVLSALFAGSLPEVAQAPRDTDPEVLAYNESVQANVDFISLRSPFFAPAAPIVRTPPPPRDNDPPPQRTPTSYGGPKLVGLIGKDGAMFASPVFKGEPFIKIGDKGVVELVEIQQPWKAKVLWGGTEFELNLFDRLEALPVVNFGGASPIGRPNTNIFGGPAAGGTAATNSTGTLDFGDEAADGDVN